MHQEAQFIISKAAGTGDEVEVGVQEPGSLMGE